MDTDRAGELRSRAGRGNGRFWLYFEFQPDGSLAIETSWLPAMPEVARTLHPLGFARRDNGAYVMVIPADRVDDHLGVVRAATKAINVLLEEGYL